MASGQAPPAAPPTDPLLRRKRDEYEAFIEERLRQTRRQVKVVDVAAGLLGLAAGALVYLLVAAIADHWLISGGLGFYGRLLLLLGLLVGIGYYLVAHLIPLLIHRINPVFAAQAIERHRPSFKNGLINLLFLRRDQRDWARDQLSLNVYRGLEEKAAAELADPSVEMAVDRSGIIRLGYLLAGVLAVCSLYLAISPKNPLVSFRRVVWPWAEIPAPTRVTIGEVKPGDAVAFQGDTLTVSAEVRGVEPHESVMLYYTTADGQSVDQAIPMSVPSGEYRYRCQIPPGSLGLQQDMEYYLVAGDAQSKRFNLQVEIPLTILVDRVHYDYPEYTGIPDRTATSGDLRAIEGTKVTVEATASKPIRRAVMELDCDPRNAVLMNADGVHATGRFSLRMDPKDPARPQYASYQLRFRDAQERDNPRPIRHQIDVIADLPPDIRLVDPPEDKIQLPADGVLELKIRAEDPDFALRRVALRVERGKRSLAIEPLLDRPRPEQPYGGPFESTYRFEPSKLKLQVDDEVTYWAEADDNKEPIGNHSETPRRTIVIVAPSSDGERQQQGADGGQRQPEDGEGEKAQQGEQPQEPAGERAGKEAMQEKAGDQQQPQPGQEKQQQDQPPQEQQEQQEGQQQDSGSGQGGDSQQKQAAEQENGMEQGQSQPQEGQQQSEGQQQGEGQQGEGQNAEGQQGKSQPREAQPSGGDKQPAGAPESGQPGEQSGEPSDNSQEPVDETNPGEAIERILQHRREQQKTQKPPQDQPQAQPEGDPANQPSQEQSQPQDARPGQQQQQPSPGQQGTGDSQRPQQSGSPQQTGDPQSSQPPQDGMKPGEQPESGEQSESGSGTTGEREKGTSQAPDSRPETGQTAKGQKNQDGQGSGGGKPDQKQPAEGDRQPDTQGGDPQSPQGDPGSGKPSEEQQGTPSPQEANQDREKKPGEQEPSEPADQEATSPTTSPKQSDSKGDEAGDRSGGGGKGGGQQADQPGTGNPGSNTPADQGGQPSNQQGEGETGSKGGDQTKADEPTGKPGSESGDPGSGGTQQPGGQKADDHGGKQPPEQQPGNGPGQQAQQPPAGQPGGQQPGGQNSSTAGNPDRGGVPGQQTEPGSPSESGPLGADDPNLQYANEQTDLALEHLKDQLAKEDPELLDRLGWDRKQAEQFVRNWQKMKRDAAQPDNRGQAARRELNSALKSLGLDPGGTELQRGRSGSDQLRNLRENRRFDPPAEWADLFRAYTKGLGETQPPPAGNTPGSSPRRPQ